MKGYKAGTLAQVMPFIQQINALKRLKTEIPMIAKLQAEMNDILQKNMLQETAIGNLIMQAANNGLGLIIQNLDGFLNPPTYGLAINYLAIGTGNTTPANTDTQLTAEVVRSVVVYTQNVNNNQLQLQSFFPDAFLPNGTYNEGGSFVGGSSGANTGQMFNHALFASPFVKTSGMDTTLEIDINL